MSPTIQQLEAEKGLVVAPGEQVARPQPGTTVSHSPGPWTWNTRDVWDRERGDECAARISAPKWKALARVVVRFEGDAEDDPQGVANARLIAAAPELLEALKACANWIVDMGASGDAGFWDGEQAPEVIAARAAIAKAEGNAQ